MGFCILPRNFQNGTFTKCEIPIVDDEMYLAYVINKMSKDNEIVVKKDEYNRFFFYEEKGLEVMQEWVENNKDKIDIFDSKYIEETNKYLTIYDIYKETDNWLNSHYLMLKTNIPVVDAYIAKETVMQIIYATLKNGNCKTECLLFNYNYKDFQCAENKLKEMEVYAKQFIEIKSKLNSLKYNK